MTYPIRVSLCCAVCRHHHIARHQASVSVSQTTEPNLNRTENMPVNNRRKGLHGAATSWKWIHFSVVSDEHRWCWHEFYSHVNRNTSEGHFVRNSGTELRTNKKLGRSKSRAFGYFYTYFDRKSVQILQVPTNYTHHSAHSTLVGLWRSSCR